MTWGRTRGAYRRRRHPIRRAPPGRRRGSAAPPAGNGSRSGGGNDRGTGTGERQGTRRRHGVPLTVRCGGSRRRRGLTTPRRRRTRRIAGMSRAGSDGGHCRIASARDRLQELLRGRPPELGSGGQCFGRAGVQGVADVLQPAAQHAAVFVVGERVHRPLRLREVLTRTRRVAQPPVAVS
jgi:hypothetical protein